MKHIKQLPITIALILFIFSLPVQAQSSSGIATIEKLQRAFSIAYTSDNLGTLDTKRQYRGKVRIVIEYPEADLKPIYLSKVFKTFERVGRWLKSKEREDGTPFRVTRPLIGCKRGRCTYDFDGGIDHNHLYIDKITYGFINRRPYIKTVFLLAG
jgi:hypothetical protein